MDATARADELGAERERTAVRLFFQPDDVKLWRRLLLLAVVGAVPLFVVAVALIQVVYGDRIEFAEQERRGVAFLRPIAKLLEYLPRYQVEAQAARAENLPWDRPLTGAGLQVEQAIGQLAANYEGELGRRLKFTDTELAVRRRENARLEQVKYNWLGVQGRAPITGAGLTSLPGSVRTLFVHAGDQSNLILDPDLDSYYLMDALLNALPQRQQRLGDSLGYSTGLAPAERAKAIGAACQLEGGGQPGAVNDPVVNALEIALNEDRNFHGASASLQARLPRALDAYRMASEAGRQLLYRLATGETIPPAESEAIGWRAHEAGARLWEVCADELDRLLEIRIAALQQERRRAYAILGATLLLAVAAMAGIIRGLLRSRYAELEATQEELRAKETRLRMLGDNLPDSMVYQVVNEKDATMRFQYVSAGVEWIHGVKADTVLRDSRVLHDQILEEDRPAVAAAHQTSLRTMQPFNVTARMRRPDGEVRWVRLCSQPRPLPDGRVIWDGIETDVTAQSRAEGELHRLNRALRTISQCNLVLVRARSEDELLESICRVLVDAGGYQLAWVGLAEHDEEQNVRVVAHAGLPRQIIDSLAIVWSDTERGRGPTGSAIRTGRPALTRDFLGRDQPAAWREIGVRYGLNSGLSLPLRRGETVVGAVTLYSSSVDAFDQAEVALMTELAGDLAFGLQALRARVEHQRAEAALAANEELLRQFVRFTPAAVAMFDTGMRYVQASDRWLADYRLTADRVIGRSHYEVFPDIPERWRAVHQRVLAGAVERCDEDPFPRADGALEWLQWEVRPWRQPGGDIGGLIMFTQVITERKRTEQRLAEQLAELRRWQELTLGREERQMQLKREINELCRRLGEPERYPSQAGAARRAENPGAAP